MLEFMKQLRQVRIQIVRPLAPAAFVRCMTRNYSFIFFFNLLWEQHVTVGVVGGSDLVKITEQLGNTGD